MLIYKNTFDNVKTIGFNFPVEDQYYADETTAIVADGITRDPIGITDFSSATPKQFVEKYPRPSGASLAAKEICDTFSKEDGTLKEKLIKCNHSVKKLNEKYISKCDFLENDYYGAVASCIRIYDDLLDYAYICDCGVIVYDSLGNIKFQTTDDKKLYSDFYIDMIKTDWSLPEKRVIVRKDFRNNLNNIQDGKCVSYGVLTGEDSASYFIKSGQIKLEKNDIVVVYSDGFSEFLHVQEFISLILNFQQEKFEEYINMKSKEDYNKYGKEKTLVLFKNNI